MAALTPYFANGDAVAVSSDGVTAGAAAYGTLLSEGTNLPDPEIQTEALMSGGALATGATLAPQLRVLRPESTVTEDLKAAVLDGTTRFFHITNRGQSKTFVYGPAYITAVYERGATGTPSRGSVIVGFNMAGDTPDDFFSVEDIASS